MSSLIRPQRTVGTTACVWGGSGKIYHTQGDFNRLSGVYTSSKFNTSELQFGNFKIIRPLWFSGRIQFQLHAYTQYKITTGTQN